MLSKIRIIYLIYSIYAIISGLFIFFISYIDDKLLSQLCFVTIVLMPLFILFIFEFFIPLQFKIKKYSSFWKGLFTIFLPLSKKSEKILSLAKKKDFELQIKILVGLTYSILLITLVFLIWITIISSFFTIVILVSLFVYSFTLSSWLIYLFIKTGREIWN